MTTVSAFFEAIDQRWQGGTQGGGLITLRIMGSAALFLQTDYARRTKDSDVLETLDLPAETKRGLVALAGKGSPLHEAHGMYLDVVPSGLPFLPRTPLWHAVPELRYALRHFELVVLDPTDVVVSKLVRCSANDLSDIRAMLDRGLVTHPRLIERFTAAIDAFAMDARLDDVPRYIRNLNTVERDLLQVDETTFDLP